MPRHWLSADDIARGCHGSPSRRPTSHVRRRAASPLYGPLISAARSPELRATRRWLKQKRGASAHFRISLNLNGKASNGPCADEARAEEQVAPSYGIRPFRMAQTTEPAWVCAESTITCAQKEGACQARQTDYRRATGRDHAPRPAHRGATRGAGRTPLGASESSPTKALSALCDARPAYAATATCRSSRLRRRKRRTPTGSRLRSMRYSPISAPRQPLLGRCSPNYSMPTTKVGMSALINPLPRAEPFDYVDCGQV